MTFKEIQELIKLIGKSNLSEFKIREGDFELTLRTDLYSDPKSKGVVATTPMMPMATAPLATIQTVAPGAPIAPSQAGPVSAEKPAEALTEPAKSNYLEVKSSMVGTFYRAASPEKPPYVEIGQKIKKGDVVCVIEAMKLFNEIESEVSGTVVKVMVEDALPVEYDQVLFLVQPN